MELALSPTEIEELRKLQRNLQGRSDYARVTCILMLSMGNTPIFVADCLGIDISTIYRYRSLYLEGGLDKLLENRYRGYQGLLNIFQIESLKQELRTHLYTDAKQVSQWVKDTFEVTYTPQGMADLLNRIGFSYKKTTEMLKRSLKFFKKRKKGMWCILPMVFILHTTAVPLMLG